MFERKVTSYEVDAGVALVTLRRPDRLNAWTARMEAEVKAAIAEAEADLEVRVVVLTGEGRGFCAGADVDALAGVASGTPYGERLTAAADTGDAGSGDGPLPVPARSDVADFTHDYSYLLGMSKPLIAAVNGPAAGVGFVLLCFADIRFAADDAKITTSFGRLGLPAEHGVAWVLARMVGTGRAADLLFSSRVVLGEEAVSLGLVNRSFPKDDLLPETLAYARRIASEIAPSSLRMMKRQLHTAGLTDLDQAAREAGSLMRDAFGSADFKEGVAALTDKRPPSFGGATP